MAGFGKTQLLHTLHVYICRLCSTFSERELSAVVFGQHIQLILILVINLVVYFTHTLKARAVLCHKQAQWLEAPKGTYGSQ
jgi:hypothetical protein